MAIAHPDRKASRLFFIASKFGGSVRLLNSAIRRVSYELTEEDYLQAAYQRCIDLGDEVLYWRRPAEKPDWCIKSTASSLVSKEQVDAHGKANRS